MDININFQIDENEEAEKIKQALIDRAKRDVVPVIKESIKEKVNYYITNSSEIYKQIDRIYSERLKWLIEEEIERKWERISRGSGDWLARSEHYETFIAGCQVAFMVIQSGFELEITKDDILKAIYNGSQENIEHVLEGYAVRKLKDDKKFATKITKIMIELSKKEEEDVVRHDT